MVSGIELTNGMGSLFVHPGQPNAFSLNDDAGYHPLRFIEKQIIMLEIPNAFMKQGDGYPLIYTYCEVYAPRDMTTNVCERH